MCVTLGRLAALCARSRRRRLARGLGAWRRRWEALHRGAAPALGRWWKARVADVEGPAAAADVAADPAPPPRRAGLARRAPHVARGRGGVRGRRRGRAALRSRAAAWRRRAARRRAGGSAGPRGLGAARAARSSGRRRATWSASSGLARSAALARHSPRRRGRAARRCGA
ncbi:hypothetical protein JL722_552 [Aureococcus anophagefferens]|nr:hypothetical protein JL722_552 [Aureococcus anophagefferens]